MRFGNQYKIVKNGGITSVNVRKVRDYQEFHNETVHEERVQIIRISDFDDIMAKMHIEHPLTDHGGWIEHGANGKLYCVKTWTTKRPID